jgi:flagellar biosynthetic protein FliR
VQLEVATASLVGLLLAVARTVAWVAISPPFATRAIPAPVKGVIAVALALPIAPRVAEQVSGTPTVAGLLGALVVQVLSGAALGFVTFLLFAAVQAAGDLIDVFGGFALAYAFDPLSAQNNSVFGRFYQLLATVLLFAVDGHLLVISGFLRSFDTLPLGSSPSVARVAEVIAHDVGVFFLSAAQIAGPLLAVFFLADVGLGLLTRIAPSLNAFSIGFPAKILLTLLLVGLTFPMLPEAVRALVDLVLRSYGPLAAPGEGG